MESKNVLIAVILSTLVLIFWATFFEAPIVEPEKTQNEITKNKNSSTPSIEVIETEKKISREEAIKEVDRVKLENENIKGSISLEGGVIDDIVFKNYKKSLNSDENITFLNPKDSREGYYIETGWASSGNENIFLLDLEISFNKFSLLADAATCHPSLANLKAKDLPMPLLAPVIQILFIKTILYAYNNIVT